LAEGVRHAATLGQACSASLAGMAQIMDAFEGPVVRPQANFCGIARLLQAVEAQHPCGRDIFSEMSGADARCGPPLTDDRFEASTWG